VKGSNNIRNRLSQLCVSRYFHYLCDLDICIGETMRTAKNKPEFESPSLEAEGLGPGFF
jgi:hypothetical protein